MTTVTSAGKLDNLGPRLENGLKRGLILSGKLVAQRGANKARRLTGRLKRSLHEGTPYQAGGGVWAIDVGTNVEYAKVQEFGSGLYAERGPKRKIPIVAKRAKVLAFKWPDAPANLPASPGGLHFFKQVMHPGVRGQPYLRPALKESKPDIRRLIFKNVIAALKGK